MDLACGLLTGRSVDSMDPLDCTSWGRADQGRSLGQNMIVQTLDRVRLFDGDLAELDSVEARHLTRMDAGWISGGFLDLDGGY